MFGHIFKYRLWTLLHSKSMLFWTLMFPIILATFFNLAFGSLNEHEKFNAIDMAVVKDAGYEANPEFQKVMTALSTGEDRMFNLTLGSLSEVDNLLNSGKIAGYIVVSDTMELVIKQSGISQSILKIFLDQYNQTNAAFKNIMMKDPSQMNTLIAELSKESKYLQEVSATKAAPNNILSYFYSLIAMTCLYGSFFGLREVIDIQANLSAQAARVAMSPVHKLKAFVYSMSASILIFYAEVLIILAYMILGLGIDFGTKTGLVLLTAFVGSVVGISFGAFISAIFRTSEGMKIGLCISISMFGSFLAGMMYQGIKYTIDQAAPWVNKINPIGVVTDAFYALYYYDDYRRYSENMFILGGMIVIFCLGTYWIVRRGKYASL